MAYKDKEKQREANKEAAQRRRDKLKGMTQADSVATSVIPENVIPNYGQVDCQCRHCKQAKTNRSKNVINHGAYKPDCLLAKDEVNRVSLPGDPDYDGVCNDPKYDSHRMAVGIRG
jgi:hypothetical protein